MPTIIKKVCLKYFSTKRYSQPVKILLNNRNNQIPSSSADINLKFNNFVVRKKQSYEEDFNCFDAFGSST